MDEQALARCCSQGDRLAEEELYRRYAARVYTLCRRYLGDGDDAKDLMQDVIIHALDKIQLYKYTGKGSLYGWISRIAMIKRQRWRMVSLSLWSQDSIPEPAAEDVQSIPQEKLLEWISQLPDLRRAVFNMYCIDGYSHKDIAKMLGISEKGSAGVLAKARAQLKQTIKDYLSVSG